MVMNNTKIYQNMKNRNWLSTEKNIKREKTCYYNIRNYFHFENLVFFRVGQVYSKLSVQNNYGISIHVFISPLFLESSLDKLNQHPSQSTKFFISQIDHIHVKV